MVNERVDHLDVNFLRAVSILRKRGHNRDVAEPEHIAAFVPQKTDHLHVFRPGGFRRLHDVWRASAGADGKKHVTLVSNSLDEPREDFCESVVVADTSDVGYIRNRKCRKRRPVVAKAPRELLGEMHGIAHRAAITA